MPQVSHPSVLEKIHINELKKNLIPVGIELKDVKVEFDDKNNALQKGIDTKNTSIQDDMKFYNASLKKQQKLEVINEENNEINTNALNTEQAAFNNDINANKKIQSNFQAMDKISNKETEVNSFIGGLGMKKTSVNYNEKVSVNAETEVRSSNVKIQNKNNTNKNDDVLQLEKIELDFENAKYSSNYNKAE